MPNYDLDKFLALNPADVDEILGITAFQYDIVCNGIELSSGAIRNHRPEVMKKAFGLAGYGEDVLEAKFRRHAARPLARRARPTGASRPASTASSCCCAASRTCARSCSSR